MKKQLKRLVILFTAILAVGFIALPVKADSDDIKPKSVSIAKASMKVKQGKKFEVKAKLNPVYAEDDYIKWEIISGKKYIRFEDSDRFGDDMDFIALKPGKAKIRCFVIGKSKKKYGDVISITVRKGTSDYSFSKSGKQTKYEELNDDFDLKVIKGTSISDSQLQWSIENPDIVSFATDKTSGSKVEFIGRKVGTTKITCMCTNRKAKVKPIVYTVHIVLDDDDDDDD